MVGRLMGEARGLMGGRLIGGRLMGGRLMGDA